MRVRRILRRFWCRLGRGIDRVDLNHEPVTILSLVGADVLEFGVLLGDENWRVQRLDQTRQGAVVPLQQVFSVVFVEEDQTNVELALNRLEAESYFGLAF